MLNTRQHSIVILSKVQFFPFPALPQSIDQQQLTCFTEAFKRQMEADAAERAEKKKKAKAESGVFRQKAIQAFREAKYENALEFYNQVSTLESFVRCAVMVHVLVRKLLF